MSDRPLNGVDTATFGRLGEWESTLRPIVANMGDGIQPTAERPAISTKSKVSYEQSRSHRMCSSATTAATKVRYSARSMGRLALLKDMPMDIFTEVSKL